MKEPTFNPHDFRIRLEAEQPIEPQNPDDFIIKFKLTLLYNPGANANDDQEIGYLVAFRIQFAEAATAGENLYDILDAHSSALEYYASLLFDDESGKFNKSLSERFFPLGLPEVLVIHLCLVEPTFRGSRLGWLLMEKAISLLGRSAELILCKPFPIKSADMDFLKVPEDWLVDKKILSQESLQRYWTGAGFKQLLESEIYYYAPYADL